MKKFNLTLIDALVLLCVGSSAIAQTSPPAPIPDKLKKNCRIDKQTGKVLCEFTVPQN